MKVVFLTAGAAGMYCGSCMHDNALAKSLREVNVDCVLQPVYTPIRTDGQSVAREEVFFGGIHVYLLQQFSWLRFIPPTLRHLLDWPPLIRLATHRAASTDAAKLGELAVSMLKGTEGRQAGEVERLVRWLETEMQPDVMVLSNLLIGGFLPLVRQRLPSTKVVVMLQGDDIFLNHLPIAARREAIALCSELVRSVDCFVVNSRFYAGKMGALLSIPADKLLQVPLSIDLRPYQKRSTVRGHDEPFRLGYLARISPEKGLHRLVDAFIELATQPEHADLRLDVAGWLGDPGRKYLDQICQRIDRAKLSDRFTYHGSPTLDQKVAFLQSLDLLCVPTEYEDPKGLFALEALACGVPILLPNHGAFGELVESTFGGMVVTPNDHAALVDGIAQLKLDRARLETLAAQGYANTHRRHSIETTVATLVQQFTKLTSDCKK